MRALTGGFIRLVQEYEQSETSGRARAAMLCLASHERHHATRWALVVGTGEHNAEGADRIRGYELLVLFEEIEFLNGCSSLLCALVGRWQTREVTTLLRADCFFCLCMLCVRRFHARLSDVLTWYSGRFPCCLQGYKACSASMQCHHLEAEIMRAWLRRPRTRYCSKFVHRRRNVQLQLI